MLPSKRVAAIPARAERFAAPAEHGAARYILPHARSRLRLSDGEPPSRFPEARSSALNGTALIACTRIGGVGRRARQRGCRARAGRLDEGPDVAQPQLPSTHTRARVEAGVFHDARIFLETRVAGARIETRAVVRRAYRRRGWANTHAPSSQA
jgi:hypothetical protein